MAKRKPWGNWRHALTGAVLFSLLAMSPVLFQVSDRKFGPNISGVGSDSYGVLYSFWISGQPHDGIIRSDDRDLLSGHPNGRKVFQHIQAGSAFAQELAKAGVSPVFCYNLMIWMWFLGAYLAAFWIFRALNVPAPFAHLGAFIIGLNPYQSLQAVDHADLAMTWPLLLSLFFLVQLMVHRKAWAVPALILCIGLSVFSHPYYLICGALLSMAPLLWFTVEWLRGKFPLKGRDFAAIAGSVVLASGAVLVWKRLFTTDGAGIDELARNMNDLYTYSTKFWDFVLPPHFSLLFERFTTEFKTNQTVGTGSNLVENTLYPGLLVLLTLPAALGLSLRRWKEAKHYATKNSGLVFLCAVLIAVPVVLSVSPTLDFLGFKFWTPTHLLHHILPQFRTMSRFGYVASVGMVIVFILVLHTWLSAWRNRNRARAALLGLFLFFTADLGYFHKDFYSDENRVPAVYTYVKENLPDNAVIFELPFMWGYLTQYWQSYHKRPNFGVFDPADENFREMLVSGQLQFPELLAWSKQRGITHLILHTNQDLGIPGPKFVSEPDQTWIFFLFARYSYVIPVN